jgi:hypothetical protein
MNVSAFPLLNVKSLLELQRILTSLRGEPRVVWMADACVGGRHHRGRRHQLPACENACRARNRGRRRGASADLVDAAELLRTCGADSPERLPRPVDYVLPYAAPNPAEQEKRVAAQPHSA